MKRFFVYCFLFFPYIVHADTMNLNWVVDDQTYAQTTCTVGGNLTLPTAPTKYGYTFQGWRAYIPIEYIESSGGQYINTGFRPNQDTRVIIKYFFKGGNWVFGARNTNLINEFVDLVAPPEQGTVFRSDYGTQDQKKTNLSLSNRVNSVLIIDKNKNNSYLYDENYTLLVSVSHAVTTFSANCNMVLFGCNTGGTVSRDASRIYYAKIYDNDTLIRDFIPVLDGSGTPCMYDKITQTCFYNEGTGYFVAGPTL